MIRRIAFCGYLRSGKDSAAAYLRDTHGYNAISIAETMKATVFAALGAAGVDTSRKGPIRLAMQEGGVAARGVEKHVWISAFARRYELERHDDRLLACSDLRFLNEAEWLRQCGFVIVRLEASRQACEARAREADGSFDVSAFDHPCEGEIDLIQPDLVLRNETAEDREEMFRRLSELATADEAMTFAA